MQLYGAKIIGACRLLLSLQMSDFCPMRLARSDAPVPTKLRAVATKISRLRKPGGLIFFILTLSTCLSTKYILNEYLSHESVNSAFVRLVVIHVPVALAEVGKVITALSISVVWKSNDS
jgi:hypothetical protein